MMISLNQKMKWKIGAGILVLLLIALEYACHGSKAPHDLRRYITELKQSENAKKHVYSTKDVELPTPVLYSADALREPFATMGTSNASLKNNPLSPLESYPLNLLQFVGTVTLNKITYAYIQAPDNLLYQVQTGSAIGDHHGKVISIQNDKLNIMETEINGNQPAIQRVVSLQLKGAHP